jgi:hypothetical protein
MLLILLDLQTAEAHGASGAGAAWLSSQLLSSRWSRVAVVLLTAVVTLVALRTAARSAPFQRVRASLGAAITVLVSLAALAAAAAMARTVAPDETRYVLFASVLIAGEVAITAALAMLFSSFSTPFVTGMLTLGMFFVGRSAGAMIELRSRQVPFELRELLRGVATVVPNLQLFVPSRQALQPGGDDALARVVRYVASSLGYGALYAALLLALSAWLFRRRDLT